ncbi:unannotated protein [freshwater metagenome]|uniref:Unannotated protein n=1 Tax=freshwater metagenome TaxID=449393 RepID=A0A6J6RE28_9ZZZZ
MLALVLVLIPVGAFSASKISPGAACKVYKQKVTYQNKVYTCVKSGKKLVWNEGVKVAPTATPTPTATPKQTPNAFIPPIPITLPVPESTESNAITFSNITSRISDIPSAAFTKAEALIQTNTSPATAHAIYIAPGLESIVTKVGIEKVLDRAMKYYAGFQQSAYYDVYIYDYSTIAWANDQYQQVAKTRKYASFANYYDGYIRSAKGACNDGDCNGSQSGSVPGTNEAYLNIPIDNGKHWFLESGTLAHSYGHTVQSAQWDGTKIKDVGALKNKAYTGWLFQGSVTQPAWTISTGTLNGYLEARNNQGFNLRNSGFKNLTAQSITNYLLYSSLEESIDINGNKVNGSAYPPNPIWEIGNSTGSMAVECLVAIGGPQSVIALSVLEARGNSLDVAFEKVYGTSWKKAAEILGQVIAMEYAQKTPTPN